MRIVVFGAGSLGCALGGILSTKHDVLLIGRRPIVRAIKKNGLKIVGDRRLIVWPDASETISGAGSIDLLIVATKAYDTWRAVRACKSSVSRDTLVLTLQNGLGNLEILRKWRGKKAFGGTTTMGAALISAGVVRVSGTGRTVVGSDMDPSGANRIVSAFIECDLFAFAIRDILSEIWAKTIVNACINPLTAVLRIQNGRLLDSGTTALLMAEIAKECEAVAKAESVMLPETSMYARARAVASDTAKNTSSMLQDVSQGRRTEIRQISGAICERGAKRGIPAPVNRTLVAMIEALEEQIVQEKA